MAHFAEIGSDNTVIRVIVAETKEWCEETFGGTWVETSYNTHGNQHPEGRPLHKNYAGIGYLWDGIGFYAPQPYPSWTKNEETYLWESLVPYPTDGKSYSWDESSLLWIEIKI